MKMNFSHRVACLLATIYCLLLTGCAGPFYGGMKTDPGLYQVKKLALINYTVDLPIEGSSGYGIVRVGALDEGGMSMHGQALMSDAAERMDNALKDALADRYISLDVVRKDDYYHVLVKKETGSVAAARDTVALFRSSRDVDVPAAQKIAAKVGADAVILVHNTVRFYKETGWYATIEPAMIRIYGADGKLLFDGTIRYTSERSDIDRSTELSLEEEQQLLKGPVEHLSQWLLKALKENKS